MTPRRKPRARTTDARASERSSNAQPDDAAARGARWPLAAIATAGVLAYANAPGHPFIFDDAGAIVTNPTIRSLSDSVWGGPAQQPTAGRPLVNISFALNYLAGGLAPWGYQAVNLAIHVACALLVFGLLRRAFALPRVAAWTAGRATSLAAAVALLWVVHPLNSEIVNYATQRTESLMALAFLGTLYSGVRALTSSRPQRWQVVSVAACAAGMSCKESMVVAPIVMLLLDATFTGSSPVATMRRRPAYYAALFATWLLLAILVIEGPRWRSAGFTSGVSPWTYLLNQAPMIARYLRLVVWPTGLVLDYGEPVARTLGAVWPSALLVVGLLGATVAAWRVAPVIGFFGTWFFLTLAPTSSFLPIATEVGAERRMYLPLVAVLTIVALAVMRWLERLENGHMRTNVARGAVGAACVVLALLTVARNGEYATGLGIWRTVVDRWPSGRAFYNLGTELKAAGLQAQAIESYQRALPNSADAHYALGFELQAQGKFDEALQHYREFIRLKPSDINVPRAYHQIGRVLLSQGKSDEAVAAFGEVLARKPGDADALAGTADALLAQDKLQEAVVAYREFLRVTPDNTDAMMNLGIALVRLDRDGEAREVFGSVVQLQPNDVAAHVNLAYAMANTGRLGDAVKEFRRALELERDPKARADIEAALAELLGNH